MDNSSNVSLQLLICVTALTRFFNNDHYTNTDYTIKRVENNEVDNLRRINLRFSTNFDQLIDKIIGSLLKITYLKYLLYEVRSQ